ncbi:tyrosine-type recombinase/integrase [Methylomonas sp. LL1]|uniref:tyrosine-type recombinase/integrase n=1 Tax=Methylomonas sp. LL1 TaxID=2785785 RepID=UPI0018C3A5D7|nr:tyrosine-type recombinase/integrase [Methylomonas sp. LL1]QPK62904.1 tyrosine-type recombinase/integrase [Methylomonas sp. LL1]
MNTVNAASKTEIDLVHTLLEKKFGQLYADIWKVGVNLSLRISDLLTLEYSQLNLQDRSLQLTEQKTGKLKLIRLNSAAIAVIERRRVEQSSDRWLFQVHSNRAKDKPVSRVSVSRVFKETGDMLGLTINTHSMRKSRGMAMYKDGVPVEKIAKVLNHSNTTSTLRYLGITKEEVLQTYDDYEL